MNDFIEQINSFQRWLIGDGEHQETPEPLGLASFLLKLAEALEKYSHVTAELSEVEASLALLNLEIRGIEAEVTHDTLFGKDSGRNAEERKAKVEYNLTHNDVLMVAYKERARLQAQVTRLQAAVDIYSRGLHTVLAMMQAHVSDRKTQLEEAELAQTKELLKA